MISRAGPWHRQLTRAQNDWGAQHKSFFSGSDHRALLHSYMNQSPREPEVAADFISVW